MVNEEQKQLAEIFKIAGFALMTPFGNVILGFPGLKPADFTALFFLNLPLSMGLFYLGIIVLLKSLEKTAEIKKKH
ncbi:MAG: hypothetical protein HY094_09045 [Candidatus Melainabacteria bacterium]|nr:hypothetical protein [Candidatus Melainabacteria bacterium]